MGGRGGYYNLFPVHPSINKREYIVAENAARNAIRQFGEACIVVMFEYDPNIQAKKNDKLTRPTSMHYMVWAKGQYVYDEVISNDVP